MWCSGGGWATQGQNRGAQRQSLRKMPVSASLGASAATAGSQTLCLPTATRPAPASGLCNPSARGRSIGSAGTSLSAETCQLCALHFLSASRVCPGLLPQCGHVSPATPPWAGRGHTG